MSLGCRFERPATGGDDVVHRRALLVGERGGDARVAGGALQLRHPGRTDRVPTALGGSSGGQRCRIGQPGGLRTQRDCGVDVVLVAVHGPLLALRTDSLALPPRTHQMHAAARRDTVRRPKGQRGPSSVSGSLIDH